MIPLALVLVRCKLRQAVLAATITNFIIACIAGFVFYSMLVTNYDKSTSSFSSLLVPIYQLVVVFIMYLVTRNKHNKSIKSDSQR